MSDIRKFCTLLCGEFVSFHMISLVWGSDYLNTGKDANHYRNIIARAFCEGQLNVLRVQFKIFSSDPVTDQLVPQNHDPDSEAKRAVLIFNLNDARNHNIDHVIDMIVSRKDFFRWIRKSEFWPLESGCELIKWLEPEIRQILPKKLSKATGKPTQEREHTIWLKETWYAEGRPEGLDFFKLLKKYVNSNGSPIIEHYSAGAKAGIRMRVSSGGEIKLSKKAIQNRVSDFKNDVSIKLARHKRSVMGG